MSFEEVGNKNFILYMIMFTFFINISIIFPPNKKSIKKILKQRPGRKFRLISSLSMRLR